MYLNARMIAVHTGTGPLVTEDPAEAGTAVRGGQCGSTSGGGHITNPALRHYANQAARPLRLLHLGPNFMSTMPICHSVLIVSQM